MNSHVLQRVWPLYRLLLHQMAVSATTTSTLFNSSLKKKPKNQTNLWLAIDWREQRMHVWAANNGIVFYSGCWYSTLVRIDQAARAFSPLSHCVFLISLYQSTVRASLSTLCYYCAIRLPSFPASATMQRAEKWSTRFLCVHERVWRCVKNTICPFITNTRREWPRISQAGWHNKKYLWYISTIL